MRALNLAAILQLEWNWDPFILASLSLACLFYVVGLCRMKHAVRKVLFGRLRYASFAAGIGILFAVLISPFDALDDQLFCAHMVQHLVLMMVAPPLLLYGRPGLASFRAFPVRMRIWLARFWTASGLRNAAHFAMSPMLVWVLCSAALWFWHIPAPYGWAVASDPVHALEHSCFFVTSLMFWWLVLEPLSKRRLDYAPALLFVATFGVQNGMMGALLTFSGHPFYAAYRVTSAAWGLTPLEDQQVGGLSMWIPAGFIHLTTLAVLFVSWMRAAEHRERETAKARNGGGRFDIRTVSSSSL
jgi:cytochrome c oxidase assembly factor CtaG